MIYLNNGGDFHMSNLLALLANLFAVIDVIKNLIKKLSPALKLFAIIVIVAVIAFIGKKTLQFDQVPDITQVLLNNYTIDLTIGDTEELSATVVFTDNTKGNNVIWISNNEEVVRIDESGKLTALSIGSAVITAQASNGKSTEIANCTINVTHSDTNSPQEGQQDPEGSNSVAPTQSQPEATPDGQDDHPDPGNQSPTAEPTQAPPTITPHIKKLSNWVDKLPDGMTPVNTRTLYSYRDNKRETTESDSSQLSGWTLYGSEVRYTSDWSAWSDTPYYQSDTCEVRERSILDQPGHTQYQYGRWYNTNRGKDDWCKEYSESSGGSAELQYSEWFDSELSVRRQHNWCGFSDAEHPSHIGVAHYNEHGPCWVDYIDPYNSEASWYWLNSTRTVAPTYKTQYQYRNKKTVYLYEQYIRQENWSDWSVQSVDANADKRDVRTKTQYQYEYYSS